MLILFCDMRWTKCRLVIGYAAKTSDARPQASWNKILLPGKRVFECEEVSAFDNKHNLQGRTGGLLQLNTGLAGKSGRRKLCLVDWDRDVRIDLLVNSQNVNFMRNVSMDESKYVFRDMGKVDARILAGHTTSPTVVDWDRNGVPNLLIGAEDGYFYYLKNPEAPL